MAKRSLTPEEIQEILQDVIFLPSSLPEEIANCTSDRIKHGLTEQLKSIKIYPVKIPQLKKRMIEQYRKSLIQPGKPVGPLASSAIGERNTQSSLNSFHEAGRVKVTLTTGIPRMEELLNATRDIRTPSMQIFFMLSSEDSKNLQKVRRIALEVLEYKELTDFIIDYDQTKNRILTEEEKIWYEFTRIFCQSNYEECSWSVRLKFNINLLYKHRLSLLQISRIIQTSYVDTFCVPSPDHVGIIDVYVDTNNLGTIDNIISTLKTGRKKTKKREQLEYHENLIMEENKDTYFIRDIVIPALLALPLMGIEGIEKCFFSENDKGEWYVTTKGSNLRHVLNHYLVDSRRTATNHLWDIYEVLGIEATKIFLQQELQKIITLSSRHLDLLINSMLHTGKPMAATRYGIDRKQVGPLAKASFECPFENFFVSATVNEKEDMKSISSAIAMGKRPSIGSGYMDIINEDGVSLDISLMQIEEDNEQKREQKAVNKPRRDIVTPMQYIEYKPATVLAENEVFSF